ncbi:uncharacterized protein Z518_00257 [Rhinocladiella mackenziei CBS 650.93]|uniref:Xylanolytic transcriptional activator regulatory domain-containing protein n=1 Tax=Rhinocladiella mackenziei CBS 650.93 TaxID=1442369 RepID=A0A0D2HET8_9EURO|nr:uncharacterized protein Z518_00257 [Rhinocladiella mackenziei CBS 650.93]KIX09178.1 hypothetical protein Z518_00257 [Rhinocladiella mackenziei CBS 650.93]
MVSAVKPFFDPAACSTKPHEKICTHSLHLPINYPFCGSSTQGPSLETLLSKLPKRAILECFVTSFTCTVERAFHSLDTTTFQQGLDQYWNDKSLVDDDWMAYFLLVLALGCQAHNSAATPGLEAYQSLPSLLLHAAELCLMRTPFMLRPTTNTIRALCLMVIAKQIYAMSCHASDTCWPLMGLIYRLAIAMGLNNPVATGNLPSHDIRSRERLWRVIVLLEIRQSINCGMPLLLTKDDLQPRTSHNPVLDVGTSECSAQEADDQVFLLEEVLCQSFPTLLRVFELAGSTKNHVAYEEIVELDADLRRCLRRPDMTLGILQSSSILEHPGSFDDLEVSMLDVLLRRALLVLHSPYALQPHSSIDHPLSYISSLESSLAILSHQRNLCEAGTSQRENTWFAGLFREEFFTAAMTICSLMVHTNTNLETSSDCKCQMGARQIVLQALQSCRDLWSREKHASVCNAHAFQILDKLIAHLQGIGRGNLSGLGCPVMTPEAIPRSNETLSADP